MITKPFSVSLAIVNAKVQEWSQYRHSAITPLSWQEVINSVNMIFPQSHCSIVEQSPYSHTLTNTFPHLCCNIVPPNMHTVKTHILLKLIHTLLLSHTAHAQDFNKHTHCILLYTTQFMHKSYNTHVINIHKPFFNNILYTVY